MVVIAFASGEAYVLAATAFFGAMVGNILMSGPLLIGRAFGTRFPPYSELQPADYEFRSGRGPILIGAIYDFGGGYQNAFLAVGGSSVLAFLLLLAAGSPDACIRQISGDRAAK